MRILQQNTHHSGAHFLLGLIAASLSRYSNAVEFLERAVDIEGDRAEYHAQLARCLSMLRQNRRAVSAAERALALDPADALTLDTLGVVLSRCGDHVRAVEVFRKAVRQSPRNPAFLFNLASSAKFIGDFDEAERCYEKAIRISPRFYKAHVALSNLRRQTAESNHLRRLEELLSDVRDDVDGELQLRHALAKEYEDLGEYTRAFEHLLTGNRRKRAQLHYSIDTDRRLFEALLEAFPGPLPETDDVAGDDMLFVVGMPRTGTTLVERILASHSQICSAGELQALPLAVKRAAGTSSREVLDADTIQHARTADPERIGQAYLQATGNYRTDAHFVLDKLPMNFLYAGFIGLALPGAKIICLRRHPLDTCLSNFRQLFALRFSYYNYAYDLQDIAHYYVLFDRLMAHWKRILPGKIFEVRYEELIEDQTAQTRRMLAFCGLDMEESCLRFEDNPEPVATASAVQVREPVYSTSVGRWKRYERQLAPARTILEQEGIPIK